MDSTLSSGQRVLPASLEDAKIVGLPQSAYYISDFITKEEESYLLEKVGFQRALVDHANINQIASAPKPRWKQLSHRRLQTWPCDLTKDTLLESPLPNWLVEPILPRLQSVPRLHEGAHIFADSPHGAPNHVLINEYLPGQGIMPHKDGSAYHPVVCTVSLGAPLCLDLYETREDGTRASQPRWRILQEPRSLLITADELYTEYMHGIADVEEEVNLSPETIINWKLLRSSADIDNGRLQRKTRTSLTFRDVIKTRSLSKFGLFGKR